MEKKQCGLLAENVKLQPSNGLITETTPQSMTKELEKSAG
jgi:hypothetical protein